MAFKFVAFATLVAAANAGLLPAFAPLPYAHTAHLAYSAPIAKAVIAPVAKAVVAKTVEYDAHPQYSFAYDVHDSLTGDAKNQHETRDGDVVRGSYSLIEADGTRRIVDYTADSYNGFNAVVRKEPATIAIKTVAAAPVVHAAPLAYTAPIANFAAPVSHASTFSYSAPVAKYNAAPLVSHVSYSAPVASYIH